MRTRITVKRNDKQALLARMKMIQSWNGKMDEDEKLSLGCFIWLSLAWAKSEPCHQAVHNLIAFCNTALVMANRGYPKSYAGECNQAFAVCLTHLQHLIERQRETKSWALDGELIMNLPKILHLYEQQIAEIPRKEFDAVLNFVMEKQA